MSIKIIIELYFPWYLEIVVAGMEDGADIVDVGVEVVQEVSVVDGCQLITCTEEILADIINKSSFFHPVVNYIRLLSCK